MRFPASQHVARWRVKAVLDAEDFRGMTTKTILPLRNVQREEAVVGLPEIRIPAESTLRARDDSCRHLQTKV